MVVINLFDVSAELCELFFEFIEARYPHGYLEAFSLLGELDDVKDIVTEKSKNLTICYLYLEKGKLKTMNEGTWGAELLDYTGETNVLKHQKTNAVNPKKLLRSNPDFIFCENRAVADKLRSSNYLKGLSALRGGLRAVAYDEITMQGATSLYAVKKMLKKMYSEDFK